MLAGNLASIGVGGIIAVVTSYIVSYLYVLFYLANRFAIISAQIITTSGPQERSTLLSYSLSTGTEIT